MTLRVTLVPFAWYASRLACQFNEARFVALTGAILLSLSNTFIFADKLHKSAIIAVSFELLRTALYATITIAASAAITLITTIYSATVEPFFTRV